MSVLSASLVCPKCSAPLSCRLVPRQSCECQACGTVTSLHLFPSILENETPQAPSRLTDASEATCFNHGDRKASEVCDGCGKFLCTLCDIPWDERHLCSQCVEREHGSGEKAETRRIFYRYDAMAVALLISSTFLWFFSFLLYPMAWVLIVLSIRHPASVMPRGRSVLIMAVILGIALPTAVITFFLIILEY